MISIPKHLLFVFIYVFFFRDSLFCSADDEEETSTISQEADSLTPSERCEACQIVLRTVYGHFGKQVSSRRKLSHQLRHECNRHYQYRRRCLLFTRVSTETIFHEMGAIEFKPIKPCTVLKECKQLHSPIIEEHSTEISSGAEIDLISSSSTPIQTSTSPQETTETLE